MRAGCLQERLASQARGIAEGIIATVSLMSKSGLPCYGRGHPLENLKKRFHLEMSDSQAAALMRKTVHDAYDKVHSRFSILQTILLLEDAFIGLAMHWRCPVSHLRSCILV